MARNVSRRGATITLMTHRGGDKAAVLKNITSQPVSVDAAAKYNDRLEERKKHPRRKENHFDLANFYLEQL